MKRLDSSFRDVTGLLGLQDRSDFIVLTVDEWELIARGMQAVENLLDNSGGVYGLHLNGDLSPFSELRKRGRYEEWLVEFDLAMEGCPELRDEVV